MKGVIDKCDLSKTKKSYRVKIGDSWYGASKDSGIDALVGKTIEARVEETDFGPWLDDIKQVSGGAPAATGGTSGSVDRFYMPFISNTVAHAIQAGLIKVPTDVKAWARQAYVAVRDVENPEL